MLYLQLPYQHLEYCFQVVLKICLYRVQQVNVPHNVDV